jgi:hypothetical protein
MKSLRIASTATVSVAALIVASIMASQSANAQTSSDISRQVINSTVQSILQSVREQIQTQNGAAVPGTAGLMRFTTDQNSDAIYQEAFGALPYAKEPLLTKAPPPASPPLIWGFTTTGSVDSQRSSVGGGTSAVANTEAGVGSIDVTKIGIFGPKDALNILLLGSDTFTSSGGVNTSTPGFGLATTYINGGLSLDFIFNSGFSHTDASASGLVSASDTTAYSYSGDFNYRYDYANGWWLEPTVGATYSESYTAGTFGGHVWTVQGGARFGTEFLMANGVKVQPTFTALAYSNIFESGSAFEQVGGANANQVVGGGLDQGQLWGKGALKFNFIFSPNFSSYIEGNVRGTNGNLTAVGYGGQMGLRWTW